MPLYRNFCANETCENEYERKLTRKELSFVFFSEKRCDILAVIQPEKLRLRDQIL